MSSFRTYDLSVRFYREVSALRLPSHLKSQLLRSASSVPLNLREGEARGSMPDRLRFYRIAYASFRESQAALELAALQIDASFSDLIDHLGASLYKLVNQRRPFC